MNDCFYLGVIRQKHNLKLMPDREQGHATDKAFGSLGGKGRGWRYAPRRVTTPTTPILFHAAK